MEIPTVILEEDEKIIKEIKPLPALKWYLFLRFLLIFALPLLSISWLFLYPNIMAFIISQWRSLGLFIMTIVMGIIIFSLLQAHLRYSKYYYWITNKRIICRYGTIGYRIVSIPLERISDIIVSRTFLSDYLDLVVYTFNR